MCFCLTPYTVPHFCSSAILAQAHHACCLIIIRFILTSHLAHTISHPAHRIFSTLHRAWCLAASCIPCWALWTCCTTLNCMLQTANCIATMFHLMSCQLHIYFPSPPQFHIPISFFAHFWHFVLAPFCIQSSHMSSFATIFIYDSCFRILGSFCSDIQTHWNHFAQTFMKLDSCILHFLFLH